MNPNIKVTLHWEYNKNGKVYRTRKVQCHSFVIGFIDLLGNALGAAALQQVRNTSNGLTSNSGITDVMGAAGTNLKGIVVGTDNTAVAMTNYALGTLITSGGGAGQLNYGAVSVSVSSTAGSTRSFTISRLFTNNSGGDITVQEVGLYCFVASSQYFCIDRTISTKLIANTASATAIYTISITV